MLELEPGEKINRWDVVVITTRGRKLSFVEMRLIVPNEKHIDELLEDLYPCTWVECDHDFEDTDNDGVYGDERCRWCGLSRLKE